MQQRTGVKFRVGFHDAAAPRVQYVESRSLVLLRDGSCPEDQRARKLAGEGLELTTVPGACR